MILEKAKTTKSVSFNGRGFERKKSLDQTEKLEIVDLSGLFLESLPKASLNLGFISMLDLSNNNLQIIPESMVARLLNVVVLDVHSNQLRLLPNSIGCLSKLKVLNVSGNLIESLPKTIENCRSLEELNANFNKLEKLPDTIGFELSNLRKLSVNSNKLAFLPHSLTHMTSLRILDVRLNCLHSLPEDLENLINLEVLNVSQNFQCLETLPYSIGLLLSLVELDASYNKISALPDSVGCLHKLKKLCMEGNPLVFPPPELLEKGLNAVREYMSERMNEAPRHKKWWAVKLFKFGTFNGRHSTSMQRDKKRFSFNKSEYRSIKSLASPRHLDRMGMFSPGRLIFSPLSYFSR